MRSATSFIFATFRLASRPRLEPLVAKTETGPETSTSKRQETENRDPEYFPVVTERQERRKAWEAERAEQSAVMTKARHVLRPLVASAGKLSVDAEALIEDLVGGVTAKFAKYRPGKQYEDPDQRRAAILNWT